ncbi:MAG: glycosyl hydrolase [Bacteroidota bacterium]|nr:glycosyl hydrolase [Bacteroidota bacterium]
MLSFSPTALAQPKSLFYMTRRYESVHSFLEHCNKIAILVPTWYTVDKDGMLWGGPDPLVMKTAKEHRVDVMPIVTGYQFTPEIFHQFVTSPTPHQPFIQSLVRECKLNGYSGIQFDFEHINWFDKDALSNLVTETAAALHQNGFKLAIATVPNAPGYPGQTGFDYWIFKEWQGAYDLESLAKSTDMICLMTYDQHTSYTAPGPVAGYSWTIENLAYALQYVPKNKLMLGIPLYGYHWFATIPDKEFHGATARSVGTPEALQLAKAYNAVVQWDSTDHTSWFYFYRDNMREWVFITDVRTFQDRLQIIKERGVEGFCSWVLGDEDPEIWNLLPERK